MGSYTTPGAGTPAPGPRPTPAQIAAATQVAAADQHLADLAALVQLVRDHRDALVHDCSPVLPCSGEWALRQIVGMGCHHRVGLLAIAVAELAALGYGRPGVDRYDLTDAARDVLDGGDTR